MAGLDNPLMAIASPDTYLKSLAIQRRQALAQALLERGTQDPGSRPWAGLANAGNELLGAYLAKRSDRDMAGLYNSAFGQTPTDPGQVTNNPTPAPGASPPPGAGGTMPPGQPPQGAPPGGPPLNGGGQPPAGMSPPQAPPQQPAQGGLNPRIAAIYQSPMFPKLPGADPMQAVAAMIQGGPAWAEYLKAYWASVGPTDAMKQVAAGLPGGQNNPQFGVIMSQLTQKSLQTTVGAGAGVMGPGGDLQFAMPTRLGPTPTQPGGPGSPVGLSMPPSSGPALAQAAAATGVGKAVATPSPFSLTGPTADPSLSGHFVPGNAAQAAGLDTSQYGLGGGPLPKGAEPTAPLGSATGAGTQSNAVVGRQQQYQQDANQVNLANNILDNMNELVDRGLKPGMSEWQQEMLRLAPSFQALFGRKIDPNNPAVLADIFHKFSSQYQLAQNAGMGSSSTDSLRSTIGAANPNLEQFGPALKQIIPWLKSINLATQARNLYLQRTGGNPAVNPMQFQQAETRFNQLYDPLMAQMALQPNTPQGNVARSQILSHVPADKRQAFLMHYKELIPYFRGQGQ